MPPMAYTGTSRAKRGAVPARAGLDAAGARRRERAARVNQAQEPAADDEREREPVGDLEFPAVDHPAATTIARQMKPSGSSPW